MTTSSLRRHVKNVVRNYTHAEVKVREATSNDPVGPSPGLMCEISELTFDPTACSEVMDMTWKRLNDHGRNWRHVYKALVLLDHLLRTGSERVGQQCRENAFVLETLRDFQYVDREGRDQGAGVRDRAKKLVALVRDEEQVRRERAERGGETQVGTAVVPARMPPPYPGPPSIAARYGSQQSPPSCSSWDLEQARPQSSGDEELQLQLALAMSREESEKPRPLVDADEQTQLEIALSLSKEETHKPGLPPPVALDLDEDMQLQLALSLSKEEHQQEQHSRQEDESLLQRVLEESKREIQARGGEPATIDMGDVFRPTAATPPSGDLWDLTAGDAQAQTTSLVTPEPWDSLVGTHSIAPVIDSPWGPPLASFSSPQSRGPRPPPADPWEAPARTACLNPALAHTGSLNLDPFSDLIEDIPPTENRPKPSLSRPGSASDGDLFGDPVPGMQVNGLAEASPDHLDLSHLRESLPESGPQTRRTHEAFLDPTAASLVNLENLIPSSPPAKANNPFMSGMSDPSPSNPFFSDQPRLTLNQMRPAPNSTLLPPSALPSGVSLPPPSAQPLAFPAATGLPDIPDNLPKPLLPLSSPPSAEDQDDQNPFL